jgi:hypothetical protein
LRPAVFTLLADGAVNLGGGLWGLWRASCPRGVVIEKRNRISATSVVNAGSRL